MRDPTRRTDFSREARRTQVPLNASRRPNVAYLPLTLRQIEERFEGAYDRAVYAAVADGLLHPVQLGGKGRIYYLEWELERVFSRRNPNGSDPGGKENEDSPMATKASRSEFETAELFAA